MTYSTHLQKTLEERRVLHTVSLELTYRCNLDCFFCYNDVNKVGTPLSLEQYRTLLRDLAEMQTLFLMLTGGEPMVHPHFFEIGRMTKELGFVVTVRTNGHNLTTRIAERLRDEVDPIKVEVSLHGATAAAHDRQTRVKGSFSRLIKNIAAATQVGLQIGVVSTPTSWNEHQIREMFALCDSLGVKLRFQGPVAPKDNGDLSPLQIRPMQDTWDLVSKLVIERRGQTQPKAEPTKPLDHKPATLDATCGVGISGVDIDPYGNVQACMHLQQAAGSLHENSVEEIWLHSPLFEKARNKAVQAAKQFAGIPLVQMGAPLYCIAVEENLAKGCGSCGKHSG